MLEEELIETIAETVPEAVSISEPEKVPEEVLIPAEALLEPQLIGRKPQLRFAEDVLPPKPVKIAAKSTKSKKKKKGTYGKESAVDGIKLKKSRRDTDLVDEEEDYF